MSHQGKMLVVTAPSGAGKTTIVRHLLETFEGLAFSVSATTRSIRPHEIAGKDYYFYSVAEFKDLIAADAFVEWEEVYQGRFYGTLTSEMDRIWAEGKHIVFDVDVKGAERIKKFYGDRCLSVFIEPPSLEVLIERLKKRDTESPAEIERRIDRMRMELTYADKFDTIILNDHLPIALLEAEHIVKRFFSF